MRGKFPFFPQSMSNRLALVGIVVASCVSALVSCAIVAADGWDETAEIKRHIDLVFDTWDRSATEAAFQLDEKLSSQIVHSIGMERAVNDATIVSDLGDPLASWSRAPEAIGFVERVIFGDGSIRCSRDLIDPERGDTVGRLAITFSQGVLYKPVVSRAKRTVASAVFQSVLVAIALWFVINQILARPLRRFIEALAAVNIEAPSALGDRFGARAMKTELGLLNRTADAMLTATADLLERNREATENLTESEQRFEAFAAAASDWFWETGTESELLYLSGKYEAVTGFPSATLIGEPFQKCVYPPTGGGPPEAVRRLSRAIELRQPFRDLPIQSRNAKGDDLFLCYSGVPHYSETGGFRGFRGAVRDATPENEWDKHRRFLTESLNHSERLKMIGQMTAGVAHNFNNLLAAIQANMELLSVGWGERSEHIEAVANAVDQGAIFTKRLLTYSRQRELSPSSFKVEPLLNTVERLLSGVIDPMIEFRCVARDDVGNCFADRGQLESVLINLCINARDAMPDGGRLTVTAERSASQELESRSPAPRDYVCFTIEDSGVGMDEETLTRATEPFFTTKPAGAGTGLGLSMAVGFADQSRGGLNIDSEPGAGTTVRLCLPGGEDVETVEPSDPDEEAKPLSGVRVLIIEDDPAVQKAIQGHLRHMLCVTACASDGVQALDRAAAPEGFDVVLIDRVLPGGLSGMGLAEKLRELLPTAKMIFMSGLPRDRLFSRPPENEPVVLEKPFGRAQLAEAVRACIE